MKCSPFLVRGDLDGHGCQIQIIRSSHQSKSNLVLPLVGTSQNPHEIDIGMQMKNDATADTESRGRLSISGVGLSMSNQHLPLGTGALFSFKFGHALDCAMQMEMSLLASSLVKMSSSSTFFPSEQLFGSERDRNAVANSGGNMICLNTSFLSTKRDRNDEHSFTNQNITSSVIGRKVFSASSTATLVSYSLCTFEDITTAASLAVKGCFFQGCQITASTCDAGAVYVLGKADAGQYFQLERSSFSGCKATGTFLATGGSVCLINTSAMITNSFFESSSAMSSGGPNLSKGTLSTLSNCAFVVCTATDRGGAIGVNFDASAIPNTRDVCFSNLNPAQPNEYFSTNSASNSTLITPFTSTLKITKTDIQFDEERSTEL
ncbi:hypothetical protein BLNAU_13553 [Blattamonas nauphoetae]|uniref:Uncharacterized protein n=1 Tax=Blattamonas nauphoetae TaxID=2049346 RepID=A0ABQ9XGE2_9EUKA|nr:hypothetical protein BLNAU_13553 [Blattamonas nauphoetae]